MLPKGFCLGFAALFEKSPFEAFACQTIWISWFPEKRPSDSFRKLHPRKWIFPSLLNRLTRFLSAMKSPNFSWKEECLAAEDEPYDSIRKLAFLPKIPHFWSLSTKIRLQFSKRLRPREGLSSAQLHPYWVSAEKPKLNDQPTRIRSWVPHRWFLHASFLVKDNLSTRTLNLDPVYHWLSMDWRFTALKKSAYYPNANTFGKHWTSQL